MNRWTTLICCVVAFSACASMGRKGQVKVDTAPIHYAVQGTGGPVVVFDAGAGDDMTSWKGIVGQVSQHAVTFAFDRPGYGAHFGVDNAFDTDADGKRTAVEMAEHLRAALQAAGLAPPYVLVGHSLGGLNMVAFAKLFPRDVQGVVLVDGRPPAFTEACREAGVKAFIVPGWLTWTMKEHVRREMRGIEDSEQFVADPPAYGTLPITVMAANRPDTFLTSEESQRFWVRKQQEFAASLANGRFVEVTSTHYIHHEQPAQVITEILRIVEGGAEGAARGAKSPT